MVASVLAISFGAGALLAVLRLPAFHPVQLWLVPWAGAVGLFSLQLLPYDPMSGFTAVVVAAGTGAFCFGALVGGAAASRVSVKPSNGDPAPWRLAAVLSLGVMLVLLLAFIAQVGQRFGLRAALISSPEPRSAIGAGFASITIKYLYFALASVALCAAVAARSRSRSERRLWLTLMLCAVASTYFSTGRSTPVLALVAGTTIYVMGRGLRSTPLQRVGAVFAVALLLMGALIGGGQLIGKTFENSEVATVRSTFTEERWLSSLALPYQYATAPIASLGVQLDVSDELERTDGCATLGTFCRAIGAVGTDVRGEPVVRPFTSEPLRWNTYTALDLPLLDGGPAGAVAVMAVLGAGLGALWSIGMRRRGADMVAYGLLAAATLFSFTQFNFFAPHFVGSIAIVLGVLTLAYSATRSAAGRRLGGLILR